VRLRALPPVADPASLADIGRALIGAAREARAIDIAAAELTREFRVRAAFLFCSGRAALTIALRAAHGLNGRRRAIVPAYTCFSVAASVVRAGLELVPCDVVPETLDFDYQQLEALLDESPALCVVPTHLFGVPADVRRVRSLCAPRDVVVVEDAAQGFGFQGPAGPLGACGDVGVFSFGRGKAFSACGGGALVTESPVLAASIAKECSRLRRPRVGRNLAVLAEAVATGVFVRPSLYWIPSRLPFLGLGETRYSPDFEIARLSGAQAGLLSRFRRRADRMNAARTERIRSLATAAGFTLPREGENRLRLPVMCRSREERDRLCMIGVRRGLGFSPMYPSPITQIPALQDLLPPGRYPGADAISDRLLTVPVHALVSRADLESITTALADVGAMREG
jgi:dTDP-4-amino-4,6-dideoxygalactose transaminase